MSVISVLVSTKFLRTRNESVMKPAMVKEKAKIHPCRLTAAKVYKP
jgi:hypothetical protein